MSLFIREALKHKLNIGLSLFIHLAIMLSTIFVPELISRSIDNLQNSNVDAFIYATTVILLIQLLVGSSTIFLNRFRDSYDTRINFDALSVFYSRVLKLPYIKIQKEKKGQQVYQRIVERLSLSMQINQNAFYFLQSVSSIFYYVAILSYLNVSLLYMLGVALAVLYFTNKYISREYRRICDQKTNSSGQLNSLLFDGINKITTLKLLGATDYHQTRADEKIANLSVLEKKSIKIEFYQGVASSVLVLLIKLSLIVYLLAQFADQQLSIADTLAQIFFLNLIFGPVQSIYTCINRIKGNIVALEKSHRFLDNDPNLPLTTPAQSTVTAPQNNQVLLSIRNLHFDYDNKSAIDNINMDIIKGQKVAIVGKSGSGKSTLLALICKLLTPKNGMITWRNNSIFEMNDYLSNVSVLPQAPTVLPLTLRENLMLGNDKPVAEQAIFEMVKDLKLDSKLDDLDHLLDCIIDDNEFSKGELQRISLGRVLLKDADLFIFDEATSSLDTETESIVSVVMTKYLAGKTVITVAHRLNTIVSADNIFVMNNGKVVESGHHELLLANQGAYYSLHQQCRI
jgi:ABC-type multidrug transport system fused ATPase/permease subunit